MRRKKPVATNIAPASLYSYLSARGAKGDDLACPTGGFSVMQDHHNHDKGQSGNDPHGLPSHNRQHHQHDQASAANAGVGLNRRPAAGGADPRHQDLEGTATTRLSSSDCFGSMSS